MKKNRLLDLVALLCNILRALTMGLIILPTFMLIYWHINPAFYQFAEIPVPEAGFKFSVEAMTVTLKMTSVEEPGLSAGSQVQVISLKPDTVYLLFAQSVGFLFVWLLVLQEVKRLLTSVQGLQTFRDSNSRAFRKIGWYCFYLFLINSFDWLRTDGVFMVAIFLDAVPLICMLISFILAEVFKEGNRLYEEEQLTI